MTDGTLTREMFEEFIKRASEPPKLPITQTIIVHPDDLEYFQRLFNNSD